MIAMLSTVGCGDDEPDDAAPSRFEPSRCRYELGAGQVEGTTVRCGDLVVPSRRDGAPATELRIHVLRFGAVRTSVAPIVWLEGGPGGGIEGIVSLPVDITRQITADRDFIVFSQRGTGQSVPMADCPEAKQIPRVGNPDPEVYLAAVDAAFLACRDRLVSAGVDLAGMSTRENADDVEDLRRALGYTQINLLGGSYGSRLALEIIRRHEASVRAAVIDAIAPPNARWAIEAGATFEAALTTLLARCEQTPACKAAFGTPMTLAAEAFTTLEAQPLRLPNAGVSLYGRDILQVAFLMMYDDQALPVIPLLLAAARDRDAATVEQLVAAGGVASSGSTTSIAMQTSVLCNDQVQFVTPTDIDAVFSGLRPEIVATFKREVASDVRRCASWPLATPDRSQLDAVRSAVPTLILSGTFDPVTPPKFGALVLETLSNARHVVFPIGAHGAIVSDCGRQLAFGFFEQPKPATIDVSCAASPAAIEFVTPN
jgi:pimeloyl-ACP methyl ester carboxylesterase